MAATMLAMGSFNDCKTQNLIVHSYTAPAFYASGPIKRAFGHTGASNTLRNFLSAASLDEEASFSFKKKLATPLQAADRIVDGFL